MSRYDDPGSAGDYPARGRSWTAPTGGSWGAEPGATSAHSTPGARNPGGARDAGLRRPGPGSARRTIGLSRLVPGRARRPRRRPRWRNALGEHPVRAAVAIATAVVVVAGALVAYALYRGLYDSIHHETVSSQMLGKRPPKLNGSLNILVIGSDSRKGSHGRYGKGIVGSRSDTAMLLHISPTHDHALMVSFPRDSMVPVYTCLPDGQGHQGQHAAPGQLERLNATFSYGGAACLWKTLENMTGIYIDHFAEVNFAGFKSIVNDVGGVSVCLPIPVNDPASGLNLTAGRHTVNGTQALAFVRERHIGLGSDLQRIQRQQYFLASAMQKVKHTNILGDPGRIYAVVHDVARSLTTDSGLTPTTMVAIANSLKSLSAASLRFISVPVAPYPGDPKSEVQWTPQATQLFRAIAHDTKLPTTTPKSGAAKGNAKQGSTAPKPAPTAHPSQVQLQVLNGSGATGVAGTASQLLASRGFHVTGTGDAANYGYTSTVIEYSAATQLPAVNTLKTQVPGAQVEQVPGLQPGTLNLILGSSFSGLTTPKPKPTGSSLAKVGKNYGGISASRNICRDAGAFAGPDSPMMFAP